MGAGVIQPVLTEFTQVRHLKADKLDAYALEAAEHAIHSRLNTLSQGTQLA